MYGGAVGEVVAGGEPGLVVHQLGWREAALVDATRVQPGRVPEGVAERAARRARDAGHDRVGGRDRHRPGGSGETVFVSGRGGGGRQHRGADREGARLPRDRQRGGAREGRLCARRARLRRRVLAPRRRARRAARRGARRRRRLLRQRRGPAARGGHRSAEPRRADRAMRRGVAVQRHRAAPGPRNLALLVGKRGRMRGFIVGDHAEREAAFREEVGKLLASGRLRMPETVVEGGIERRRARSSTCCAGGTWARSSSRSESPTAAGSGGGTPNPTPTEPPLTLALSRVRQHALHLRCAYCSRSHPRSTTSCW